MADQGLLNPQAGSTMDDLRPEVRPLYDGTLFPTSTLENTSSDPEALKLCIMCDKEGTDACGKCGGRYCSRACQKADWPYHKMVCKFFAEGDKKKKSPDHIFCFSLPRGGGVLLDSLPLDELVKRGKVDDERCKALDPNYRENHPARFRIELNGCMPWRRLGHGLRYGDDLRVCPEHPWLWNGINRTVLALSPPGHSHVQYGPVVVMGFSRSVANGDAVVKYEDVAPRDWRSVIDFLHFSRANSCIISPERYPFSTYGCTMWPAVKVNCAGDITRFSPHARASQRDPKTRLLSELEDVMVPSIPLNTRRYPAAWPELLDLPWVVQPCLTNVDHRDTELVSLASTWFVECSNNFNMMLKRIPKDPYHFLGSFLVMHENGRPIHRFHVLWLYSYMTGIMELPMAEKQATFGRFIRGPSPGMMAEVKDAWEDWWDDFERRHEAPDLSSPWESA